MTPEVAFGKALKLLRTEKGLSQERLALLCGLDRTFISFMERGLRQPSLGTIYKIASVLSVPPSMLIQKTEELSYENNQD